MKINIRIFRSTLIAVLLAASLLASGCSAGNSNTDSGQVNTPAQVSETQTGDTQSVEGITFEKAVVTRVVDGDTVVLSDGSRVRFIGMDTPESTTTTEFYGNEASDYAKGMLTGKTVYLEKDVSETDRYGRLLRYVWLSIPNEISDSEIRSRMFNAILVLEGYAQSSTYPPDVKYQEYLTRYNSEARNAGKGLWNTDSSGTSYSSEVAATGLIKGNINSEGERIYHVPGGKYYEKTVPEQWFNTEEEARAAGFRKSKR
ncbi:MAG TPA: thermonuclease family protein [Clostridiaceae bacterium]|nr:thermonuclease family protein [Clostridiaceae bacterium]